MKVSPFDHRQDRELGDALREALNGSDESAFVHRVVASASTVQQRQFETGDWFEILSDWAKPGLAAAALGVVAAAILWWSGSEPLADTEVALADPLQASEAIPAAFLASQAPDLNEVLALELGN